MDSKTLTGLGLILGMIGTIFLALPSLRSRFKEDKGRGASVGILKKPFEHSEDKLNRRCTWSGLGLIGIDFFHN